MNQKERFAIALILLIIAIMVCFDLFTDTKEGAASWHLLIEGSVAAISLFGVFYIMQDSLNLKHKLEKSEIEFANFKKEAELWKQDSRKYIDGLSVAIDSQLTKWNLSTAEKEVAFLLLKGMSLKEIADIRCTAEKTARAQSAAIYSKAGLNGRSELSAYFLEDLLVPQEIKN